METITNTQTVERMNSHTDRRNQPGSFDPVGFTVVPPRSSRTYASPTFSAPQAAH